MKPDWLKCKTCLWWDGKDPDGDGHCHNINHGNGTESTGSEWFCNGWVCANCWQTWEEYFFLSEPSFSSLPVYQDHNKCAPVQFGVREE